MRTKDSQLKLFQQWFLPLQAVVSLSHFIQFSYSFLSLASLAIQSTQFYAYEAE